MNKCIKCSVRKLSLSVLIVSLFGMYLFVPPLRSEEINPLVGRFKEIRDTSLGTYGIFMLTNTGQRDIDDILLTLYLKNANGDTLSLTSFTDATAGFVWLESGQSTEAWLPLDHYEDAKALLETNPDEAALEIEVKSITYMTASD